MNCMKHSTLNIQRPTLKRHYQARAVIESSVLNVEC